MLLPAEKVLIGKQIELVLGQRAPLTRKPYFDMLFLFLLKYIFKVLRFGLDINRPSLVLVYNDVHLTYL